MTLLQIVKRIAHIPAFACLVGQGVFGAIPWDMMSFLLLLLDWKQFTKDEIVLIQLTNGVCGALGGALGGVLGDVAANKRGMVGRVAVAFTSVVGGSLFYGLFLFSTSFHWSLLWSNLFQLWGGWTPAATNRPLCAHLARNPSERAHIVAAWILMEKTSAAVFGAPLVGYMTKHMMDSTTEWWYFGKGRHVGLEHVLSLDLLLGCVCCVLDPHGTFPATRHVVSSFTGRITTKVPCIIVEINKVWTSKQDENQAS